MAYTYIYMHVCTHYTQAPGVYDEEYLAFLVRYSDAPYVQNLKIKILCLLTNASNFMKVYTSPRVCAYVCVCHLVCARMYVYVCMFYVFEFVYT